MRRRLVLPPALPPPLPPPSPPPPPPPPLPPLLALLALLVLFSERVRCLVRLTAAAAAAVVDATVAARELLLDRAAVYGRDRHMVGTGCATNSHQARSGTLRRMDMLRGLGRHGTQQAWRGTCSGCGGVCRVIHEAGLACIGLVICVSKQSCVPRRPESICDHKIAWRAHGGTQVPRGVSTRQFSVLRGGT